MSPRLPYVIQVTEASPQNFVSYNKLLGRVASRILSNIHNGALLQK